MAEGRAQVDFNLTPEPAQAPASGGDTYFTPAMHPVQEPGNTGSKLMQLGNALSELHPALQGIVNSTTDYLGKKDMQEGILAAAQNKLSFSEAVKSGVIEPGRSPWFKMGYEDQRMRILAQDYDTALRVNYAKGGYQVRDDVDTTFVTPMREHALKMLQDEGINPNLVGKVFLPLATAADKSLLDYHQTQRASRITQQAISNTGSEAGKTITQYWPAKVSADRLGDPKKVQVYEDAQARMVAEHISEALKVNDINSGGKLRDQLSDEVFKAVYARALEEEDTHALEILKYVKYADGKSLLKDYPDIQLKAAQAKITIEKNIQQRNNYDHWNIVNQRTEAINGILRDKQAGQKFNATTGKLEPYSAEQARKDIFDIDPQSPALDKIEEREYRNEERAFKKANEVKDSTSNRTLYNSIWDKANRGEDVAKGIEAALSTNQITDKDAATLQNLARSRSQETGLEDPVVKDIVQSILFKAPVSGIPALDQQYHARTIHAQEFVQDAVIKAHKDHPEYGPSELRIVAKKARDEVNNLYAASHPQGKPPAPSSGSGTPVKSKSGTNTPSKTNASSGASQKAQKGQTAQEQVMTKQQVRNVYVEWKQNGGTHPTLVKMLKQQGIPVTPATQRALLIELNKEAK